MIFKMAESNLYAQQQSYITYRLLPYTISYTANLHALILAHQAIN
jgi:hypothetical protein